MGVGELVFNTALSGYQEIVTDPSYAGQVITFTYPHIGNYGVNADDDESRRPFCAGVVVRDLATHHSNWRATGSLDDLLVRHHVPGITGIDTRRLTRHLRDTGARPGAFGTDEAAVRAAAGVATGTDGIDLVATVTTDEPYVVGTDDAPFRVVAYDFGIKRTILRHLVASGCRVEVVPASTTADEVLARDPDGVFLSNGPGDPARRDRGRRRRYADWSARCRSSASASVTRSSASRSAPAPTSCSSATTAATTPCATRRPAGSRSPARTTTTRSPPTVSPTAGRWRSPT